MDTTTIGWEDAAGQGNVVRAILTYRDQTRTPLAEAKAFVERWLEVNRPPSPDFQMCSRVCDTADRVLTEYVSWTAANLSYTISVLPPDRSAVRGQTTLRHMRAAVGRNDFDVAAEV